MNLDFDVERSVSKSTTQKQKTDPNVKGRGLDDDLANDIDQKVQQELQEQDRLITQYDNIVKKNDTFDKKIENFDFLIEKDQKELDQ